MQRAVCSSQQLCVMTSPLRVSKLVALSLKDHTCNKACGTLRANTRMRLPARGIQLEVGGKLVVGLIDIYPSGVLKFIVAQRLHRWRTVEMIQHTSACNRYEAAPVMGAEVESE